MHVPFDPAFPLLGIQPDDTSLTIQKYRSTRLFIATLQLQDRRDNLNAHTQNSSWKYYGTSTQWSTALCVAGNKNKENLYKLIWRDFQDILSSKNNKRENYKEYLQYTTLQVRKKGNVRKHVSAHLSKEIQEELTSN